MPSERRIGIPGQRDDRDSQAFQLTDETEQLVGGAAFREDDGDVLTSHDAEVAVQRVHGMQERCRCAGGCEGRGDLACDQPRLPQPRDDHSSLGAGENLDRAREGRAERLGEPLDGCRLEREHPLAAIDELLTAGLRRGSALRLMHGRSPPPGHDARRPPRAPRFQQAGRAGPCSLRRTARAPDRDGSRGRSHRRPRRRRRTGAAE